MCLDRTFAALSDPTRVGIVDRLSHGPASVTDIASAFPLSLRGVLKHVQVLEDAGIVRTVKQGRVRRCELRVDHVDASARWLAELRRRWEGRLDRIEGRLSGEAKD
jgi:DNA-binding transcriptional ArsR family regulator